MPVPADLDPGFYFVLASHDAAFSERDGNVLSAAAVWVSELALVVRSRPNGGELGGLVVKALSGEPVANASVQAWVRRNNAGFAPGPAATTDRDGLFAFTGLNRTHLRLLVKSGGHALASGAYWSNLGRPSNVSEQTFFFTDRSLYRPGQTVSYKGLCIRADRGRDAYETLAGQKLTVVFRDPNNKEIERRTHKCNAFGSFSGSFTAPRDRLTGRMSHSGRRTARTARRR